DLSHHQLVAIQMPAGWTAASLTFQARPGTARNATANETFQDVYDSDGNEVTVTAAEDRYVSLTGDVPDALTGCSALKVRSVPAGWTAASLTFQARAGCERSATASETFEDVYESDGKEVTVTAAEDRYVSLTGNVLYALTCCGALKVRSGTPGTPVAQDADRT